MENPLIVLHNIILLYRSGDQSDSISQNRLHSVQAGDCSTGQTNPIGLVIQRAGRNNSPATLGLVTDQAAQLRATLGGVRATCTHTVKEPFLSQEWTADDSWFVSFHVLVGDLLSSFYTGLSNDLDRVVRIDDSLGIAPGKGTLD